MIGAGVGFGSAGSAGAGSAGVSAGFAKPGIDVCRFFDAANPGSPLTSVTVSGGLTTPGGGNANPHIVSNIRPAGDFLIVLISAPKLRFCILGVLTLAGGPDIAAPPTFALNGFSGSIAGFGARAACSDIILSELSLDIMFLIACSGLIYLSDILSAL